RLVLHYAEHPEARDELGIPAPADRYRALAARPVLARSQEWVVGADDEDRTADWYDATRPLLRESVDAGVQRSLMGMYRGRLLSILGVATVPLGVGAGTGIPAPAGVVAAL